MPEATRTAMLAAAEQTDALPVLCEPGRAVQRGGYRPEVHMSYLSDANLRAILAVLVRRAGGEIVVSNEELYDAMLPASGTAEPFLVEETSTGVRIFTKETEDAH